ncbi:hypothetical protein BH20ACI1_BH20ACI1_24250 [soil metagenome]
MDVATATNTTFNPKNFAVPVENVPVLSALDAADLTFEIGVWLSGLESFLNIRNHSFAEESGTKAASRDWTIEFRLTYSTLLLCSKMAFQLERIIKNRDFSSDENDKMELTNEFEISVDEVYKLSQALKDSVLLNEGLLRAAPLKFGEWTAWSNFLSDKLKNLEAVDKLIQSAEKTGEEFLPDAFRQLLETRPISFAMEADLRLALPRFAKILKWLSVIEKMLKNDEPLKTSLLLFSRIYEQIHEMMTYINNRLRRFPNEEDELFGSLDGAAYTASIELRKVYNYELAGLAEIRPTPAVYAKMETAFSLLNDSFQQTLVNFAQLIEPNIEPTKLFPNFQSKFRQSMILRQNLWDILQSVKKVEQNPDGFPMNSLHKQLTDFIDTTLHFLFYKDMETVERFIEEVLITTDKKDLVPILHRFGAYLDTLFGQINMRVVLAKHPFEYRNS